LEQGIAKIAAAADTAGQNTGKKNAFFFISSSRAEVGGYG